MVVRVSVVLVRLSGALACSWYVVSCGGQSFESAGPPEAGSAGVGGGGRQGDRAGNGGAGGTGRGGSGASGGAGAKGGASARGGSAPGGESGEGGEGGAGVGGVGGVGGVAGVAGVGAGATGGQSGSAGTAGTNGQPPIGACEAPYAWSENLESCNGDFVHRPTALGCTPPPRDDAQGGSGGEDGGEDLSGCDDYEGGCQFVDQCTTDADCGSNAYCIREVFDDDIERIYYHLCYTPCGSDADCADGELCACDYAESNATRTRVQLGMCVPANCRTDADCEGESLCVDVFKPQPSWVRGSTFEGFHCQSPADECYSTERCPIPTPDYDCCAATSCNYEGDRYTCGWQDMCNLC